MAHGDPLPSDPGEIRHPELVLYDVDDRVATITFNRPDRMNGMIGNMELVYLQRLVQAAHDPEVRAIVVTGAGRGFCPGADLAYRAGEGDLPLPNEVLPTSLPLQVPKPIIAAINGACAGAGLGHAMLCDMRIAAAGAKFTTAFSQRGLIAEYGLAWHLAHVAGRATALDLLLTARVLLAEDMAELGLVNRVVPVGGVVAEAQALARELAANVSPTSMKVIKDQVLNQPLTSPFEAMTRADELMYESLQGDDVKEGITAFLEKRPVDFPPLP